MRRREFMTLIGGVAAAWPLAARAQKPTTMKRIAMVHPAEKVVDMTINGPRAFRAFFEELGTLGYVEGRNLLVESNFLVLAFKAATATIPIVATAGDPVNAGFVSSIAHPGGNITGVAVDAGVEIIGKRLGLLLEAIPKPSNAKFLGSRKSWEAASGRMVQDAARHLGLSITGALLDGTIDEAQYRSVFATMEQDRVDALVVSAEVVSLTYAQLLVDLAAKSRIPAIYAYRETVALGGLMAYANDWADTLRRAADAIVQILKGVNPGDIPFFQATKFQLVINAKTAKALGLEIPPALLLRADEVIE